MDNGGVANIIKNKLPFIDIPSTGCRGRSIGTLHCNDGTNLIANEWENLIGFAQLGAGPIEHLDL